MTEACLVSVYAPKTTQAVQTVPKTPVTMGSGVLVLSRLLGTTRYKTSVYLLWNNLQIPISPYCQHLTRTEAALTCRREADHNIGPSPLSMIASFDPELPTVMSLGNRAFLRHACHIS